MARLTRVALVLLLLAAILIPAYVTVRDWLRTHPQDVPWTRLRLDDPVGRFTQRKLTALTSDTPQCRALLAEAAADHAPAPSREAGADCGYADGTRLLPDDDEADFAPAAIITACPVAAAMTVFERQKLQQAAQRHFGQRVAAIDHAGSYSCRRVNGRETGRWSEHATADAIDIFGFRLADGTQVSVLRDWTAGGRKAAFLREVRDGACHLFATVLSPNYNAAHADHLHFDQAERGAMGRSLCR